MSRIIPNGYIQSKAVADSVQFDEKYNPVTLNDSWGDPIKCQYRAYKLNYKGRSNYESFTEVGYEILIDLQPFDGREIRLISLDGVTLSESGVEVKSSAVIGSFSVVSIEPLEFVGQVKITT